MPKPPSAFSALLLSMVFSAVFFTGVSLLVSLLISLISLPETMLSLFERIVVFSAVSALFFLWKISQAVSEMSWKSGMTASKLSAIELRMDQATSQKKDVIRHISQFLQEFDSDKGNISWLIHRLGSAFEAHLRAQSSCGSAAIRLQWKLLCTTARFAALSECLNWVIDQKGSDAAIQHLSKTVATISRSDLPHFSFWLSGEIDISAIQSMPESDVWSEALIQEVEISKHFFDSVLYKSTQKYSKELCFRMLLCLFLFELV